MRVISKVQTGSWGAVSIYFAAYLIIRYWNLAQEQEALVYAAGAPLVLLFFVVVLNHRLNHFWAGGYLQESSEEIEQITGDRHNYLSAPQEIQQHVDEFDDKALGHHVTILSGIVISVVAPVATTFAYGAMGIIPGLACSAIALTALSHRSYRELNRLAMNLSTPYKEKYESQ